MLESVVLLPHIPALSSGVNMFPVFSWGSLVYIKCRPRPGASYFMYLDIVSLPGRTLSLKEKNGMGSSLTSVTSFFLILIMLRDIN